MSSTLIYGGSGKVARHLTRILSQTTGNKVYSIIRKQEQCESIKELGGIPIIESIEESTVDQMTETLKKYSPDVVVWSAGAGGGSPERTEAVDRQGAIKSMDACAAAGVKRYIIVSALDLRDRENKPVPDWYNDQDKDRSNRVWESIGTYMRAKLAADKELRTGNTKRKLDYTIVRPGGLNMEPATGKVDAGKVHLNQTISREDVAYVIAECIKNSGTIGKAFDIVGGETKISEAINKVVENNVDTFEGYY